MKSVCSCLILIFVLLSVSLIPAQSQAREDLELSQEVQEANSLINQNQVLKSIQNGSDQVGIGTVQDITYGAEKSGAIFTYAKIEIDSPFTSNLRAQQVITAKYPGGHVGNITIIPNYLWVSYKNDTVKLPETYDLTKGSQILFFINETSNYLMGYLPSSTFASSIDDFLESSMTPLLLETNQLHGLTNRLVMALDGEDFTIISMICLYATLWTQMDVPMFGTIANSTLLSGVFNLGRCTSMRLIFRRRHKLQRKLCLLGRLGPIRRWL